MQRVKHHTLYILTAIAVALVLVAILPAGANRVSLAGIDQKLDQLIAGTPWSAPRLLVQGYVRFSST